MPSNVAPVLTAAALWRDRCLLNEGAIFSDEHLWTAEVVQQLVTFYTEALDTGEGDFFSKLEKQLEVAPPETSKLFAEMLWVTHLVPSVRAMGADTKRHQIRTVYAWSGEELDPAHPALGEPLDTGLIRPGTAWFTHRWREMVYFVLMLRDWYALDRASREKLLEDPFRHAEWLDGRTQGGTRMLPHMLSYLLFPETFERSASRTHKQEIVQGLIDHAGLDSEDIDYGDRVAVDRVLLQVRESLGDAYNAEGGGFYAPPLRERWDSSFAEDPDSGESSETDDEAWLRETFGSAKVWLLSAGPGGRLWPEFERYGIAAIGWDGVGDLKAFDSRDVLLDALRLEMQSANPTNSALACWEFAHEMAPGDRILARGAGARVLGSGVVEGDYRFSDARDEFQHVRDVVWDSREAWALPEGLSGPVKTLTDMTAHPGWLRQVFEAKEGADSKQTPQSVAAHRPYSSDDAMQGLFMSRASFTAILDSLASVQNLILQGPPGVGKTYVARRVAYALLRELAPERVEFVQFHQSYSYEDFVQGWRPAEGGGFELRDGVFHRFCRRAAAEPDESFVFIIDEINRGNLSRIFGELLMLIEADKRGKDHAISLTYSPSDDDRFFVPQNVFILGLMNTADRSLAIVDYALRRRFGFHSLSPAFGESAFESHLIEKGVESALVHKISDRLSALNQKIHDDSRNLGPGYQIGHSYFVPKDQQEADEGWYRAVIRTQILPLIREYWFDSPDEVDRIQQELL